MPLWLNEGLAEFYSTFELVGDREALLGRPVPGHLEQLNQRTLLPLEELLNVKARLPAVQRRRSAVVVLRAIMGADPPAAGRPASRRDKLAAYVASLDAGSLRARPGAGLRRRSD